MCNSFHVIFRIFGKEKNRKENERKTDDSFATLVAWSPRFMEKVQQDIRGHGVKEQLQTLCNVYAPG
jgi:ribosomal protein L22